MEGKRRVKARDQTAKPSVASALAVMLVEDNVRQGKVVRIPSLGIELTEDKLRPQKPVDSPRTGKG